MLYTLVFGAPVRTGDGDLGTLKRIILNNGVANQFTVNPSGLFSGPERVLPISDILEAASEGVTLDSDIDWKAYSAFEIERFVAAERGAAPYLMQPAPGTETISETRDTTKADGPTTERSVTPMAVVLTGKTQVGDAGKLAGLVIDTGIPKQILVEGGAVVPFEQVGVLDEQHIALGQTPPRLDGATPPGSRA